MPKSDPPDHTQVKGTMKSAIQERVLAPARKPSGSGSNHAPDGGEASSCGSAGVEPTASEIRKGLSQARQSAMSVDTLRSSAGIRDRQEGHRISMCGNYATKPRKNRRLGIEVHDLAGIHKVFRVEGLFDRSHHSQTLAVFSLEILLLAKAHTV